MTELPTSDEYLCNIKRQIFHAKAFTFLTSCVLNLKTFFRRGVLDEILNLIESVSEDFPSFSCISVSER